MAFKAGSFKVPQDYNFVASMDIHKPDIDRRLTPRYGSQLLTELMDLVGGYHSVPTHSLEFKHYEEDWIMPKIKATSPGGAAGAEVTLTLDSSSLTVGAQSPYDTGSTVSTTSIPVRVGDLIAIKPVAGTVSASSLIRAYVTEIVSVAAGTFKAQPIDSTEAIPVFAASDEIIIYSNAFGEGSSQPAGRSSRVIEYQNSLQIIKDTHEISGTERDILLWFEVTGADGRKGWTWAIKGEKDTFYQFLNYREGGLLYNRQLSNTALAESKDTDGEPLAMTEGLIPYILDNGQLSNYSSVTGWTLQDAENLVKRLDKEKGSKQNLLLVGIELSRQIDNELGDRFVNGGISYGSFNFDEAKKVALEFDTYSVMGYKFHKRVYDVFNDNQTFGSEGYNFNAEGMVIPMDHQVDAKSRETIASIRKRYLANPDTGDSREMQVIPVDLKRVGDTGQDKFQVRYISHCGFEGFAGNRFAYIKQA